MAGFVAYRISEYNEALKRKGIVIANTALRILRSMVYRAPSMPPCIRVGEMLSPPIYSICSMIGV